MWARCPYIQETACLVIIGVFLLFQQEEEGEEDDEETTMQVYF